MKIKRRIQGIIITILFIISLSFGTLYYWNNSQNSSSDIIYVWFFGYVGKDFYPMTQLGINQTTIINVARTLEEDLGGKDRLSLVTAVSQIQGSRIRPEMYEEIRTYVTTLRKYATIVYGRLDLWMFNLTSKHSIYSEIEKYVYELNINGIWFDHPAHYYEDVGHETFNNMMQNITNQYPDLFYILNSAKKGGVIIPDNSSSWSNRATVSPSVGFNSYEYIPTEYIKKLNKYYDGRVLLHLDAFAKRDDAPMGVFADQTTQVQIHAVGYLHRTGLNPEEEWYRYSFLFPIMGGWTCLCSIYNGTLYNSLTEGRFARSTIDEFTEIMRFTFQKK
jgi:hypothetical protein